MSSKSVQIAVITTFSAILLWGSVKLGGTYRIDLSVPFDLSGVPAGLAPSAPVPNKIDLTFRGTGWQLMYILWNEDIGVTIDAQSGPSFQRLVTLGNIGRFVRLPEKVELIGMDPDTVMIVFEAYEEKLVPLRLGFDFTFADGYGLSGRPVVTPESVTVGGAGSVVASVREWSGGTVAEQNLTAGFRRPVRLREDPLSMLVIDPEEVGVTVNVQPIAEKRIEGLPVEVQSVPPGLEVVVIPPHLGILVRGGIDQLSRLEVSSCSAVVDFAQLSGDTVRTIVPTVTVPAGLDVVAVSPERCQFVIRRPG